MTTENLILKIRNNMATLTWLKTEHPCKDRIVKETYSMFNIAEDSSVDQLKYELSLLKRAFNKLIKKQ